MSQPDENLDDLFKQAQAPPPGGDAPSSGMNAPLPGIAAPDSSKMKFLVPLGVFAIVVLAGVILVGPGRSNAPELARIASSHLLAIGHQDYGKAYGYYSPRLQAQLPFPTFESKCVGDPNKWLIDEVVVQDVQIDGGSAVVLVVALNRARESGPKQYPVTVRFEREGGAWKIVGVLQ